MARVKGMGLLTWLRHGPQSYGRDPAELDDLADRIEANARLRLRGEGTPHKQARAPEASPTYVPTVH